MSTTQTPGPWIISHYHAECDNRPARFVSRVGGKGWPECLTNDGYITLGGAGPRYCFASENSARAAIAQVEKTDAKAVS